jgi:hypothetical protein
MLTFRSGVTRCLVVFTALDPRVVDKASMTGSALIYSATLLKKTIRASQPRSQNTITTASARIAPNQDNDGVRHGYSLDHSPRRSSYIHDLCCAVDEFAILVVRLYLIALEQLLRFRCFPRPDASNRPQPNDRLSLPKIMQPRTQPVALTTTSPRGRFSSRFVSLGRC